MTKSVKHMAWFICAILFAMLIVGCAPATPATPAATAVTEEPTEAMTAEPTEVITEEPTEMATAEPTETMTEEPTEMATEEVSGPPVENEASETTIGETLGANPDFAGFGTILSTAITNILSIDLTGEDDFTLFIPNARSASQWDQADLTAITSDTDLATDFFGCYIAEGSWTPDMLADGDEVTMVGGQTFTVNVLEDGAVVLRANAADGEDATLVSYTSTANGVIYAIAGVLCQPAD